MENSPKSGFPWNFTTVVTAQGYCYVKAYKMKWDPVLKKSKRHLQRHGGRLLEDDRIKISPKFSAHFRIFSGSSFPGANKKPVREAEYRQDFPATPGPAPEDEDACNPQATLDVGLTWAAMQVAENSGIRSHLHEIFGEGVGRRFALPVHLQTRRWRSNDDVRSLASKSLVAPIQTTERTENL